MNLYLAASSKDRFHAGHLIEELTYRGHSAHDWTSNAAYDDPGLMSPVTISEENLEALRGSQGLLWLVTDHASTGAGVEVGYAMGLGIPIVTILAAPRLPDWNVYAHSEQVAGWAKSLGEALNLLARILAKVVAA